jgi:hypothetical protein
MGCINSRIRSKTTNLSNIDLKKPGDLDELDANAAVDLALKSGKNEKFT